MHPSPSLNLLPRKRLGFFSRLLDPTSAAERYRLVTAQIQHAEAHGFDTAWVAQHHFHEAEGGLPAPLVFLSQVAARTQRIRLGTGIITLPMENPIRVAEDEAVLDAAPAKPEVPKPAAEPVAAQKATPRPAEAPRAAPAQPAPAAERVAPAAAQAPSNVTPIPVRKAIVPAGQPLPPQPSINEISPETLASAREVEKRARRLTLMELTERTCKWPIGDPATEDFWFCGLPSQPGKPYCDAHVGVAFQPMSARRDRRR